MKSFPQVIDEIHVKWVPGQGIYSISIAPFKSNGFRFQSLPEMLGKNLRSVVQYIEGRSMFLDLPIKKLP